MNGNRNKISKEDTADAASFRNLSRKYKMSSMENPSGSSSETFPVAMNRWKELDDCP